MSAPALTARRRLVPYTQSADDMDEAALGWAALRPVISVKSLTLNRSHSDEIGLPSASTAAMGAACGSAGAPAVPPPSPPPQPASAIETIAATAARARTRIVHSLLI